MSAQSHRSDPRILDRRTLERDHRALACMLRPGLAVLDIGCGTGAITAGIAKAVAPSGYVVGIDRDAVLIDYARATRADVSNLRFEVADALELDFKGEFDIVTSARAVQWMADPAAAIVRMRRAAKLSGKLVVLDYNHARNRWEPEAPPEFGRFYAALLAWREANGWDNEMADRLPDLFRSAGLNDIEFHNQDEIAERGQPDFAERTAIWVDTIGMLGDELSGAGFITQQEIREARDCYSAWIGTGLTRQILCLRAAVGTVG